MKSKRDIYKSMAKKLGYSNVRSKEAVEYIFDKISRLKLKKLLFLSQEQL